MLEGVAETFRDAVLSFCKDDTMRCRWMRYLPPATVADEFWGKLRGLILDKLKNEPIVRSRKGNFYRPSQLSWIPLEYEHYERSPLFPDLDQEIYMDSDYSHQDFELLKPLGSTMIKWNDLIDRLENDLNKSNSKMRSPYTDDPVWHERVATLLSRPFANSQRGPKSQEVCGRLRSLPLVALRGGKWASGLSEIYFPSAGHGEIPADLDQNFVCPKLLEDASGDTIERFFSFLGVKKCNIKQVLQWIRQRYDQPLESLTIENSIQHLSYFFWNLPEEESLGFDIRVVGSDGAFMRPGEIYLPDVFDRFSAKNLFDPLHSTDEGYPAKFLPSKYLQAVPESMRHHGRSWSDWLGKLVGITPIPRMTCETGLTEEFRYIMTYRVHSLVGLLRKHWSQYESLIPLVSDELRACMVDSQYLFHPIPLENSYFPSSRLGNLVKKVPWNGLLFIRIRTRGEIVDEDEEGKWIFLKQVGVRFSDDLDFYMMALGLIVAHGESRKAIEMSVFNVYKGLTRNWSTDDDATRIR